MAHDISNAPKDTVVMQEHRLLKDSYSRWGKQLCFAQLLVNSVCGVALHLIFSTHNGAPRVLAFLDITLALVLCIAGIASFRSLGNGTRVVYSIFSLMSGSVVCALSISEAARVSLECSLHQLAYKGCSDFETTPCSVNNLCSTELLIASSSTCLGPTTDTCLQKVRLVVICGTCGLCAFVFHGFVASVCLYTAVQPGIAGTPFRGPAVTPVNGLDSIKLESLVEELQQKVTEQTSKLRILEEWRNKRTNKKELKIARKGRIIEKVVIQTRSSDPFAVEEEGDHVGQSAASDGENVLDHSTEIENVGDSQSSELKPGNNDIIEVAKGPRNTETVEVTKGSRNTETIEVTKELAGDAGTKAKKPKKRKRKKRSKSQSKETSEIVRRMSIDSMDL